VFERIFDGLQTISKGDIIRLSTKPAILGRVRHLGSAALGGTRTALTCTPAGLWSIFSGIIVMSWCCFLKAKQVDSGCQGELKLLRCLQVEHFSIPQVVLSEGCYSGGRVTVCALPVELLGSDNLHTWPLRRLEGKVSDAQLAEHCNKELGKVWPLPLVQMQVLA
jgi:hypothetical protein